jgi:lipid A disaccharide synthetase
MSGAQQEKINMATGSREKDIKLLVTKFVKLVESLDPGERLSIKKVGAKKGTRTSAAKARSAAKRTNKASGKKQPP